MSPARRPVLTQEQRRLYASEKLVNFRWICKIVATYSPYVLTERDVLPENMYQELAELGQFAEIAYSAVSVQFLLKNFTTLSQPRFPLDNFHALQDVILVDAFHGSCADLPVYIVYRPSTAQLVVSISGTSSVKHVFQDLRALKIRHPSGKGAVHSGFWALFRGIRSQALEGIRRGLAGHSPRELVLTGHSMGGSVSYLLLTELLAAEESHLRAKQIQIVVFGSPRVGDAKFVNYFRTLVASFRKRGGNEMLKEFSIKAFNDGVPALPPVRLGYRHFSQQPIYAFGGKMYRVPSSECEHAMFHVQTLDSSEESQFVFPKGGHNYYNGRNLEYLIRRISWLVKARPTEEGWEARYQDILRRKS